MHINSVSTFLAPLNQSRASDDKTESSNITQTSEAFVLDLSAAAKNIMASKTSDIRETFSSSASFNDRVKNAQKTLSRLLLSHNLNPKADMDFKIENGRLVLTGENSDKQAIERALNENSSFLTEVRDILSEAEIKAQEKLQTNYKIALKDDDNKDDEEKKLALTQKLIEFSKQVASVADSFSISGGTMSFAAIDMASSLGF